MATFLCYLFIDLQNRVRVKVFNATFNNISLISWQWVLFAEENGIPGENHWPIASHWGLFHLSLSGRGGTPFFFIFLLVVGVKPYFLCWLWGLLKINYVVRGGGGEDKKGNYFYHFFFFSGGSGVLYCSKFWWWWVEIFVFLLVGGGVWNKRRYPPSHVYLNGTALTNFIT